MRSGYNIPLGTLCLPAMEAAEALKLTELINKEKKYTKKFRLLNANPPEDPWEVERRRRAEAAAVAPPSPPEQAHSR